MIINDAVLENGEKLIFALRQLYAQQGYKRYQMSKFEEYDLYARNKDFLVSDNVITFTDTTGKLLALKPDVTLSIIKGDKDNPETTKKVFYNENVYRVSKGSGSFQETMQTGVECFGNVEKEEIVEVISLAVKSLETISSNCVLSLSNMDIIRELVSEYTGELGPLYQAISEKNLPQISALYEGQKAEALKKLLGIQGSLTSVLAELDSIVGLLMEDDQYCSFRAIIESLSKIEEAKYVTIDFSVTDDINYYNGIVFKGYVKGIPSPVLSGGQYDRLMKKMKRNSKAIGFAVYMDTVEQLYNKKPAMVEGDSFINVALPKGRLGEKVYAMFEKAGYECPSLMEPNRKLVFENKEKGIRFFWVKPSDVAIYVERGTADIGVAGKDILLEYEPDVYELLDLKIGKCRMAVAGPKDFKDRANLRVATKFAKIAQEYYQEKGRDIDIIHLNGSIEIAPILGLSDVIVDIVETGATLRENNLEVLEEIVPISARLIANKSCFKFKSKAIGLIVKAFEALLEETND
ncbi:MAG: ATP phosphoribosyltransferase [Clostridia bacterium]|nr:ATP phosphoribosyltransferase [Clostridia bacterium]